MQEFASLQLVYLPTCARHSFYTEIFLSLIFIDRKHTFLFIGFICIYLTKYKYFQLKVETFFFFHFHATSKRKAFNVNSQEYFEFFFGHLSDKSMVFLLLRVGAPFFKPQYYLRLPCILTEKVNPLI